MPQARAALRYGARVAARLPAGVRSRVTRQRILKRLPQHAVGAEIGVFKGDFSAQLLRWAHPQRLYLIDPWACQDYRGAAYSRSQDAMDGIRASVESRFARQVEQGQVVILASPSTTVSESFTDELDWVYLDGDHTYEAVKQDLACWADHMKPGGIIAGDDYGNVGWWKDGVRHAVDEFARVRGVRCDVYGTQFLLRMPVPRP